MRNTKRLMMFVTLLAGILAGGWIISAQDDGTTVIGGDEATLRAFIERYIGGPVSDPAMIRIGEIPDLPFDLTLPADTTLLGSVDRDMTSRPGMDTRYIEIVLNTTLMPEAVLTFYENALSGEDWRAVQTNSQQQGGFAPGSSAFGMFCYRDETASLNVDSYRSADMESGALTVRVQIPADAYQCSADARMQPPNQDAFNLLPTLTAPDAVEVEMNGGLNYFSPTPQAASTAARLLTDISLTDLMVDYNAQLAAAGWSQQTSDIAASVGMSRWSLSSDDGNTWIGMLILLETETGVYDALLFIERR